MTKIDELIEKYTKDKLLARGFIVGCGELGITESYTKIDNILDDLKQLKSSLPTQQDKVVVPEFVADWYEKHKDNLEYSIYSLHVEIHCRAEESEFENWVIKTKNKPIETLIHMKDGYIVEKEPLYYIYLPKSGYLGEDSHDGYFVRTIHKKFAEKRTEKEIKAIDERYWAFAVPVKEESD